MHPDQRFARDPAVVSRRIGEDTVLVPVRTSTQTTGAIFALNDTAALIWEQLQTQPRVAELIALITDEYDIDEATAHADISELLEAMLAAQVIQEVG